jgi:hypothetical protein
MIKVIRPAYPIEFSIGLLLLIFVLSAFISFEIFNTTWRAFTEGEGPILGMALSAIAIVIMALILWEEFLFPVRIKPVEREIIFRNHFTKLKTQIIIYCAIPAIVIFIYLNYKVNAIPFFIWASLCVFAPIAGKLRSGLKNYNDFLRLTNDAIEYKNNNEQAVLKISDIREMILIRDEAGVVHKIRVRLSDNAESVIDLDEMELEAYYQTIEVFMYGHYSGLVK